MYLDTGSHFIVMFWKSALTGGHLSLEVGFEVSKDLCLTTFALCCGSRCELSAVSSLCHHGLKPSGTVNQIRSFRL